MKKSLFSAILCLSLVCFLTGGFPLNAQDVRTLLRENPERLSNIHHSYEPPEAEQASPLGRETEKIFEEFDL